MPPLYLAPQTVALNIEEGYVINVVTGDSIQPLLSSTGDTLITGVPVRVTGKVIPAGSVAQPATFPVGEPKVVPTHLNVFEIPEDLIVRPVNENSLKTFTPGTDTSSAVLLNSTGDTILTGVPIPVIGKVVPCIQPQPVKALPLRMKDNASMNLKYLDVEQGMNSSEVASILEDSQGNIWFGTLGGGANKYNGVSFTHYTQEEGLARNIISMLEDRSGNLWFGTTEGACMYNGETFTHFTEKEGLSNNVVSTMMEDSHGNLWFGTGGGGVCMFDGVSFIHFTEKEGLCGNDVRSILEDSLGNLWFGTFGKGVSRYNGTTFTQFTGYDGLATYVNSILEDSHNNLWFGAGGEGAILYNGETSTYFLEKDGLSNMLILSMLVDRHGDIFLGTMGGGVSIYDGLTFTHITKEEGLSDNSVLSILEDSHGNIWFGTDGGGVCLYKSNSFTHNTTKEGLSGNEVTSILEDRQGNLWLGTGSDGVSIYNGETFTQITNEERHFVNYIMSGFQDREDNIWFGSSFGGAFILHDEAYTYFTEKEGFSGNMVSSMLEDSQDNLWFGTNGGEMIKYDGKAFTHLTEKEGLSTGGVFSMMEDSRGNLWLGIYNGAIRYKGETFTHFSEKEGLSSNIVLSMLEDSRGNIWFGTAFGGVSVYHDESFTYFTEREGLSNNIVWSILEDRDNNIWLGTEKGLNLLVFDTKEDPIQGTFPTPIIHTYGLQDGLKTIDFSLASSFLDSKNRIWWGGSNSLVMLDMNHFKTPNEPPRIQLNHIEINEQFADFRHLNDKDSKEMEFKGVAKFYNYPINLELPYKRNHMTFHFFATDWSAQNKVQYSFRMEGFNNSWSKPSTEAVADYRQLPYGTYTFKVRAIGAAQKWSESFDYSFSIKPPWWHTWWARTGYALITFLIIFSYVRWRTSKLKQRQKELEAEVHNATIQLREQKEEVETQRDEIEAQKEEVETQRDAIEDQKEEIESQRDLVVATNKALEEQKRELESTLENLKLAQSQLIQSEKMASVGILTAGIAHELNNPINFVSGNVNPLIRDVNDLFNIINKYEEIVKANKFDGPFGEVEKLKVSLDYSFLIKEIVNLLEGIEDGANRSSQIVKGLRSFSRLDEEKPQLYNIHEGIDSALILMQNKIKNRINIRKEYGDLKEIECFPSKLNQVILNILTNSLQAIEDKGEIIIQTVSSGIGVKIFIKDTGKGMTPEVKKHIFDPFYTTKDVGKGTGLGLSISYGIIEQHNGNIDVISEPNKGTEFIISLPKTQPV